jgi:hypothetical protein
MIRAIRWLGYAWLGMATALALALLAMDWMLGGAKSLEQWITLEYMAILAACFIPGIVMVALEIIFERQHGIDEDR